jgi:ribosome-associated protein
MENQGNQGDVMPSHPEDAPQPQAYIELNQFLKLSGIARSGGEAKYLVDEGEVSVNSEKESRRRRKLYRGDSVQLEGVELNVDEYLALGDRPG